VPTYEYECPECPRVFEVRQRISEPPLERCDRCGGPVRRLLSSAPFILKGGGWHATDYPSESRKKAMKSESSSGPKADGESKSSTPPAASSPSGSAGSGERSSGGSGTTSTGKTKAGA
jgi:putative FmdB family regulatory protein